jgi:ABC-type multidrug transport system fused ATPase/permease subunit
MLSAILNAFRLVDVRGPWALLYLASNMFSALLEVAGLAMVFVFFQAALDPTNFGGIRQLSVAYEWLGCPPLNLFLAGLSIAVIVFFVVRSAVLIASIWIAAALRRELQLQLTPKLFHAYMRQPYIWHLDKGTTHLVNNVAQHTGGVVQHLIIASLDIVAAIVTLIIYLGAMAVLRPIGAAIAVVAFIGLGLAFYFLLRVRLVSWGRRTITATDSLYRTAREAFRGIKIVKLHGLEDRFTGQMESCVREYTGLALRNTLAQQTPRIALELVLIAGVLLAVALAFGMGGNAAEVVPAMVLFGATGIRILPHVTRILGHVQSFQMFIPTLEAIRSDLRETLTAATNNEQPTERCDFTDLALRNICFAYANGDEQILVDCSLKLTKGDRLAVTGLSGAGKTTLIDLLLGLIKQTSGAISLNGLQVDQLPYTLFSYVPQDSFTVLGTLRANIALGVTNPSEELIQRAVDGAALRAVVQRLPNGLDTMISEDGAGLSGGERQRLGIARALYRDAPILVMDEPTSSLDALNEAEISAAVDGLGTDKTVVLIAHRLSTIKRFERIVVLDAGRIVTEGKFDELYARNSTFQSLVDALSLDEHGTSANTESDGQC